MSHVLIVADGDVPERAALDGAWPGWDDGVALVVAADGGALRAERLGRSADVVVGDGDSLGEAALARLLAAGVEVRRASPDKDESDAELALLLAVERGATRVTMLGAFGGRRLDHALANIALLAHPALAGRPVTLLDGLARVALIRAPDADGEAVRRELPGRVGDLVSLLPQGAGVEGVTTHGLRYPLLDEPLPPGPARGLSNVRLTPDAAVSVRRGDLLVVEHPSDRRA